MNYPVKLPDIISRALQSLPLRKGSRLSGLPVETLPLIMRHFSISERLPVLVAFSSNDDAIRARDMLLNLVPAETVAFYPGREVHSDTPAGFTSPYEALRLNALALLGSGKLPEYFMFTLDILEEGLASASTIRSSTLKIQPGGYSYSKLRDWLQENGYENASLVTEPGTYALRGSIIDCYPVNMSQPVRMDFMGEDLEEIRDFDIHSQTSTTKRSAFTVLSLNQDKSDSVPLLEYFHAGWLLLKQLSPETWVYTSPSSTKETSDCNLDIELIGNHGNIKETLPIRWERISSQCPRATAYFASERSAQYDRVAAMFPHIPFTFIQENLTPGFSSEIFGILVITPAELWNRPAAARRTLPAAVASLVTVQQHIETLKPGDPIIHVNYGIGQYQGLSALPIGGTTQECLTIEYQNGDKVYVSTDKISLVLPYVPVEGRKLVLDSLNSRRWERVKRQTRRSAEEVVNQLAELYSRRAQTVGIQFPDDDDLQNEMEEAFPYEDTPDQIIATIEIKDDMERSRPMDRLLCGDVGFGKTELAMRAAFKCIRGGYQVALLAPTTILADQHFITFRARLEPFAVNIRMLSRFISAADQRKVLRDLAEGTADLIIGTHRILSGDIQFKRLGLLIIDEEHRFGVKQKERIKELRAEVDVLSLTATPIPRTLHFSMAGIRDISRLDTPPLERIPIITAIHYYSNETIKKAVERELARGGQVYFVHSDVNSIERIARDITELLPGVSICVAHGQMSARDLEKNMLSFSERKIQILVCTSIIESGIDLPNVNTVIINNAHRFGLAQLYQIRGRVGRSSRQAYAFLLIPRRPQLTPEAAKRLKTIERHTALGSGYAISLKDLEIRGTGNIFGLEQSGHVAAVGLDLYTKIIRDIARERNLLSVGHPIKLIKREDISVRIFPHARIPEGYVPDPHLRLNLYRRLAAIETQNELDLFREECTDRFGNLPDELEDLFKMARLSIYASKAGVSAVNLREGNKIQIEFRALKARDPSLIQRIQAAMEPIAANYRFLKSKEDGLRLLFHPSNGDAYIALNAFFEKIDSSNK